MFANSSALNSEKTKKNYWSIKDGDQTYRILPASGSLSSDPRRWNVYYAIHYGYVGSDGKMFPFTSCEKKNWSTKMVEIPDAAKERIEKMEGKLKAAEAAGDDATVNKLKPLLKKFNMEKKYHLNVVDLQGNIGTLKVGKRTIDALELLMKKGKDQGIDYLAPDTGAYITFTRSGNGNNTLHTVELYRRDDKPVFHKIDTAFIQRFTTQGSDLATLYSRPTSEEIKQMVEVGATAVDAVRTKYKKVYTDAPVAETQAPAQATHADHFETEDDVPSFTTDQNEVPAAATAAPAPTIKTPTAPKATPQAPKPALTMSDDEFLASL